MLSTVSPMEAISREASRGSPEQQREIICAGCAGLTSRENLAESQGAVENIITVAFIYRTVFI